MFSGSLSSSASFLRSAFGFVSLNPAGLTFGTRYESGPAIRPLLSNPDGAWFFFQEMAGEAETLVSNSNFVMQPLERIGDLVDISRRLYLDEFKMDRDRTGRVLTLLGATEYRHFAPMKCVGDGKSVMIQGMQHGSRPEHLILRCQQVSANIHIQLTETLAFRKDDPIGSSSELSLRFLRNDFLRRVFGFREKGLSPELPWEPDHDSPEEYLSLALRLAGQIYLSRPEAFFDGFMLMALGEADRVGSIGPVLPVNRWYPLSFAADGQPRITDLKGRRIGVSEVVSDSPSYVITSMIAQRIGAQDKPALAIGWNKREGFHVEQRRAIASGLSVFPAMADLVVSAQMQLDSNRTAFERLPHHDQMGLLGAYYSLLANEKHADC